MRLLLLFLLKGFTANATETFGKFMRKIFISKYYLLLIILFTARLIPAHTYYVDSKNGNNQNNGLTPQAAWRSINKVNDFIYMKDDTVSFKSGLRYSGYTLLIHSDFITFNSYGPGNKPVLDGQGKRNCVSLQNIKNIQFHNLKFVNGYPRDMEFNGCKNIVIDLCNVDSCAGKNIFNQNIYSGQGNNLIIKYSTMSFAGNKTGGGHGLYIDGTDNSLIEFDTLISNKNDNLRIAYGYTYPYYTNNLVVRNCVIKYAGDENISDDGSRDSKFNNNILENDTTGWSVNISLFEQNGYSPGNNDYYNNTFIIHDYGKDNAGIFIHLFASISKIKILNNTFYLQNKGKGWAVYAQYSYLKKWVINRNSYYSKEKGQNHIWYWQGSALSSFFRWQKLGFDKEGNFIIR